LDPALASAEEIAEFKERYDAQDLNPFRMYLEQEGLKSQVVQVSDEDTKYNF
jgi:pyruvate oxidase